MSPGELVKMHVANCVLWRTVVPQKISQMNITRTSCGLWGRVPEQDDGRRTPWDWLVVGGFGGWLKDVRSTLDWVLS